MKKRYLEKSAEIREYCLQIHRDAGYKGNKISRKSFAECLSKKETGERIAEPLQFFKDLWVVTILGYFVLVLIGVPIIAGSR